MATLDELQAQLEELNRRVNEITAPPDDYYTHRFSGEEIDNAVDRVKATPGSGAITAGDVRAAPDGIISATIRVSESEDVDTHLDAAIREYFNAMKDGTISFAKLSLAAVSPIIGGASWAFRIYRASKDFGTIMGESYDGIRVNTVSRVIFSGVLGPWEWENPAMVAGYEYRMTERYLNKPVYIKVISLGAGPEANAVKTVSHGVNNMQEIISYGGSMNSGGSQPVSLPGITPSGTDIRYLAVNYTNFLWKSGSSEITNYTGTAWVKYTKTTD